MLDRFFRLSENRTNVRTELLAGLTTFLTMAYIIFLQPAILTGSLTGQPNGMDFGAVMTATCLAAALATALMGLLARYPIAQAPGMGENFFFLAVVAAAGSLPAVQGGQTAAWQVALGVVFLAGVLFLLLSLAGVQQIILDMISGSLRNAIAVGIGVFIAFIGLRTAGVILPHPGTGVTLNADFTSPDLAVFFFGLLLTAALHARRIRGSIVLGIFGATLLAVVLKLCLCGAPAVEVAATADAATQVAEEPAATSALATRFKLADGVVEAPPSIAGVTWLKMDLRAALSISMLPFVLVFLFMDLFDTLGTLVGVGEQADMIDRDGKLPRMRQAMIADAVGTVAGAAAGTSTVTSFIESTAGVEQGGRTGLTALTVAGLFLAALFFSPIIEMVGSYAPITAPALVIVGSMMMTSVMRIDWSDFTEALPAFLIILGIPLSNSIADGLALGFVAYPLVKLLAGRARDVRWLMYVLAAVLTLYFLLVRAQVG